MKCQLSKKNNERGSSTTSVLIFASAIAVSSGMLVSQLRDNKKAAKQETEADIERRVNEAALQSVTQLITNGSLYYNSACGIAEPQINGSVAGYEKPGGCGTVRPNFALSCNGGPVAWRYERRDPSPTVVCKAAKCETVDVCVPITRKDAAGNRIQEKVPVTVSFVQYAPEKTASGNGVSVERSFGYLRAQRSGRTTAGQFYSTLNAKVNFGAKQDANKGLIGKHGAADTCFYMRPATVAQDSGNLGFAARAEPGAYSISQLEPRPDGKLADEFERPIYPEKLTATVTDADYAVLSTYRDNLINTYYKSAEKYRGARPANEKWSANGNRWKPDSRGRYASQNQVITNHQYSGNREKSYFIGVMPEKGAEGGPDFQYFLTGSRSRPTQWDPASTGDYRSGCGSAGTNADFCTKVYIPYKEHKATLNRKCIKESVSLESVSHDTVENANNPPQQVFYADRAVQVSCSAAWVDKVQALLAEEKIALDGRAAQDRVGRETTAEMAIAALEVDDDFLDGRGKWALNPNGQGGIHPLRAAYDNFRSETMSGAGVSIVDKYTVKYESDKDISKWITETTTIPDPTATPTSGATVTSTPGATVTSKRVIESVTPGKKRDFSIYKIENLGNPIVANRYTSMTCAYFSYFYAANPTQCTYSYTTKDEAGFVCRNNDGCFDETTLIRMSDGSDRLITELRMGEFVYNPVTKMPARITKLTIGPELKPLINVSVGGRVVKVTDTHPFMTRRGWIQAKNLKTSDQVLSGNKIYLPVTALELGASGRTVANLALEGPASLPDLHYVLANGVVTGDLVIQNMLELKASSK
jgi:hypothetical protein